MYNDIPLFIPPKNPDFREKGYEFGTFVFRPYFIATLCSFKPRTQFYTTETQSMVILLYILAVIDKKMLVLQQLTFKIESLKFENNHILSKLLLGLLLDKSFDFLTRTSFLSNFFCHDCGMKKQFQYEIINTLKHHYWSFSRREACK